jgi:hypothetical protein
MHIALGLSLAFRVGPALLDVSLSIRFGPDGLAIGPRMDSIVFLSSNSGNYFIFRVVSNSVS